MPRSTSPHPRATPSFSPVRTVISARALIVLGALASSGSSIFVAAHAQGPARGDAARSDTPRVDATRNNAPRVQDKAAPGDKTAPPSNGVVINGVPATADQTDGLGSTARATNAAGINVLVLALEPLMPQRETVTTLGNTEGSNSVVPQQTIPRAPVGAVPAIRPASQSVMGAWGSPLAAPYVVVSAKATKKDKMPKPDFTLTPEALPPNYYPGGKPPIIRDGNGATTGSGNVATASPAPRAEVGESALPPLVGLGSGTDTDTGLSQFLAAPLRRAVAAAGYTDALDAVPGSPSLVRVINARRLSTLPLTDLRNALWTIGQSLNAPAKAPVTQAEATGDAAIPANRDGVTQTAAPNGGSSRIAENTLQQAARAASRIGQAMGYRAVVVASAVPAGVPGANGKTTVNYTLLVVDTLRETCEPIAYDATGTDPRDLEMGAATGATLVLPQLAALPPISGDQKAQLAQGYYQAAMTRSAAGDTLGAKELAMQAVTLNPSLTAASKLLSDLLAPTDPAGALEVLRRATQTKEDGETWGKLAISQVSSPTPDWPGAVTAGNRALALGYDSAALRVSLAIAQLNRARLYRNATPPRDVKADDAETSAREHLDRAFTLEPANPAVIRLLADQMVANEQYEAAVKVLDKVAAQYPEDMELQKDYAMALMGVDGRSEDAFAAWARAWRLAGAEPDAVVDEETYARLAEGFDRRLDSIGGSAARLSLSVAMGALGREAALLQMTKLQTDVKDASAALKSLQPPANSAAADAQEARALAAALMDQAVKLNRTYLETFQEVYRTQATERHRQAIVYLKLARAGG